MPGGHDYIQYLNETVNPANGSVSLRIQMPSPAGRGISLPLVVNYDSAGTYQLVQGDDNSGDLVMQLTGGSSLGGWSYSAPTLSGYTDQLQGVDNTGLATGYSCSYANSFVFQDATGDRHQLPITVIGVNQQDDPSDYNVCSQNDIQSMPEAGDASVEAWAQASGAPGGSDGELAVADAHGNVYFFRWANGTGAFQATLDFIEDTNGNEITQNGSIDTMNRSTGNYFGFSVATESTPRTFRLNSQQAPPLNDSGYFECGTIESGNVTDGHANQEFQSIALPNGTAYQFQYDATYGLLSQVTYPTGGWIKYDWGINPLSDSAYFFWSSNVGSCGGDSLTCTHPQVCSESYDWPAIQHRYVSFDGKAVALQQDFTYDPATETTTVLTNDFVQNTQSKKIYSYSMAPPPPPLGYPTYYVSKPTLVEAQVVTRDSSGNTLQKKTETWFDARHKQSEDVQLSDGSTAETDYKVTKGGISRQYSWDYASGLLATSADQNDINAGRAGATYLYQDPLFRLSEVDLPDGGSTKYSYSDTAPLAIASTLTSSPSIVHENMLDGFGRTIQNRLLSDPSGETDIDTVYTGGGQIYSLSNPYRGGSNGGVTYRYNAVGRNPSEVMADGSSRTWAYSGNATTFTDESQNSVTRVSDSLGRLTSVTEPGSRITSYTYDALDNLTTVHQAGQNSETPLDRSFTYDSLSRLITAANPETGTVCYGLMNTGSCQEGYDSNGNLLTKADARNITVSYSHDALNRMTSKSASDGSFNYSYGYDDSSHSNGIGRLTSSNNNVNAGASYSYDAMGRIVARTVCVPDNCNYVFGPTEPTIWLVI